MSGKQVWQDVEFLGAAQQSLAYRRINDNEMTLSGEPSDSGGQAWTVRFNRKD